MLTFLNSVVLPILTAALIPLIIHFLSKRRVKVIEFSSLRFLKQLENRRIRHVRLYQILLIIVRTLFILFIVLAFARPTIRGSLLPGAQKSATTAVLLIDDSYSMRAFHGTATLFQTALQKARDVLTTFSPDDRIFLFTAGAGQINSSPLSVRQAKQRLKHLRPGHFSPDFRPLFPAIADLFRQNLNVNRELYLISDWRIPSRLFPDSLPDFFRQNPVRLFAVTVGERQDFVNAGIDTVIIKNQIFESRKPITFSFRLHNDQNREWETILHLFRGAERQAMQSVTLPPLSSRDVLLKYTPRQSGFQTLMAEIEDDDLLEDNRYYFSVFVPDEIKILFVTRQLREPLKTALDVLQQNTILRFTFSDYKRWQGVSFRNYNVVVLDDPPALNPEVARRLKTFTASGKSLMLIPGESATPAELNRSFRAFADRLVLGLVRQQPDSGYFSLRREDLRQPILREWLQTKSQADLPKIFSYFRLNKKLPALFSLTNGDPLVVQKNIASGRFYCFALRFEPDWSDLPIKGLFLPLLYGLFNLAGQTPAHNIFQVAGKAATVDLPLTGLKSQFYLQPAGKEAQRISPDLIGDMLRFRIPPGQAPGHVLLREGDTPRAVISVNHFSGELSRPYVNPHDLTPRPVVYRSPEQVRKLRTGRELWYIFLILAILMLMLEILIIKQLEKQYAPTV